MTAALVVSTGFGLAVAVLLSGVVAWARRWAHRHRLEQARLAGARHHLKQLKNAADMAISRKTAFDPGDIPTGRDPRLHVTVADVQAVAREAFNLTLTRADAAAMLRQRLELRGYTGLGLVDTDAYAED